MLVDCEGNIQKKLLENAIRKAGSERKLEKLTGIPNTSINAYKNVGRRLTYERFKQLLSFLGFNEADFTFGLLDPNEFRVMGGAKVYQKYLTENRFDEIHQKMRLSSSRKMKSWHEKMKKEHAEEYYNLQYTRFKKIAKYKFRTERGELVRNELEKRVADLLFDLNSDYSYEPYVKGNCAPHFPDFKIGNTIIECTAWKGFQKAYPLLKKIVDLEKAGYIVKVIVPDNLRSFYKPIEKNIISLDELKQVLPR